MDKSSKIKDAIAMLKITNTAPAVLAVLEMHVENAEAEMLSCSPTDPNIRDRLVKSQTLRTLFEILKRDLK